MNIEPELLRQIQVEGITDEDYSRIEPKIEIIKQVSALSTNGLLIFDFYKMEFRYISSEYATYGKSEGDNAKGRALDFLESQATFDGMELMWKACADMQNFYRELPAENRNDYITHWNYSALCKSGKRMLSSKCVPLEFAPDGRVWLTLETFALSPDNTKEPFCMYNTRTNVVSAFDLKTHTWEQRQLSPLSDREKDILLLMAQGKSVKDVAIALHKSEDTIRSHQKMVFKKLGVHSTVEAIGTAKKYRLIKQGLY